MWTPLQSQIGDETDESDQTREEQRLDDGGVPTDFSGFRHGSPCSKVKELRSGINRTKAVAENELGFCVSKS